MFIFMYQNMNYILQPKTGMKNERKKPTEHVKRAMYIRPKLIFIIYAHKFYIFRSLKKAKMCVMK